MSLLARLQCKPSPRQLVWALIFFSSQSLGWIALRRKLVPPPFDYLLPAMPLITGFFYMWVMVGDLRRTMDELQLRIYLEAAAITLCGLFVVMFAYPLLELTQLTGKLDYLGVLFLIVFFFLGGYLNAVRRYR